MVCCTWCVAPGASGIHRVCVCNIHQNGVLLADACNMSYREMMSVIVCDINNKICILHCYSDCHGEEALLELLRRLFEKINNDFIQFQQWKSTDRPHIITMLLPVDDLIENEEKKNKQSNCTFFYFKISISVSET